MKPHWTELLTSRDACFEAVEWAQTQPSFAAAWADCERGDWMLWLAGRVSVDRKLIVLAACACARLTLNQVSKGEDRPRIAIETAERWAKGTATIEDVIAAQQGACAASSAAAYAAASSAAAYAATTATATATAYAAAYAATAAAAYAARKNTLKKCAVLVRETISARRVQSALHPARGE